ncbi:replication initiation protein, partial [Gilliamella sp. Nev3-1]|uniref:replication initiation protein n=1 Tax=Gilliamella sp. Nev3-1 TaxID=3120250 RepID=UPI001146D3D7
QKQTITVEDFIKQFPDITKGNAYNQIKKAIDTLGERWIKVKDPKRTKEFRWIQSKEYFNDQGSATIEFSNAVMPYLCQLEKQFTNYQLRNISAFKRTYSIRLYELLTQYRSLKSRTIRVVDLRIALQLEDKFKEFKEL